MPRGFKRAESETREAYKLGLLLHPRKLSFIGRKPDGSLHLMLFGVDKVIQHAHIEQQAKELCQGCPVAHYVGVFGEWDHKLHALWNRCDCRANGRLVCSPFHLKRHGPLRWKFAKEKFPPCLGIAADPKFAVLLPAMSELPSTEAILGLEPRP